MRISRAGLIAIVIQISVPFEAYAQALAQSSQLRHLAVVQFGMPADAKFVFCEGEDCPTRSLKHFAEATPKVREPMPVSSVMPIAIQTLDFAELAQTRQEIYMPPTVRLAKKRKRRPIKVAIDCRSVPVTK